MTETVAGWPLGLFAIMTVMTAIIAGSTGIRMLFIDGKYGSIVDSMADRVKEKGSQGHGAAQDNSGADRMIKWWEQHRLQEKLSDVRSKREANRRGVNMDGFCIIAILGVGFGTALGISPSLYASVAVATILFLSTMIPFYHHAQNVLKISPVDP